MTTYARCGDTEVSRIGFGARSREQVLIWSKVGTHGTVARLTPASIRQTLHESMKRLHTDYLDILFIHYPDPRVEYDDIAHTLRSLKQEGSIRCYGLSNFDRRELCRWPFDDPPAFLQHPYSLLQHQQHTEVADVITRHHLTAMVYAPLAMGLLAVPPDDIGAAGGYPQMLHSQLSAEGRRALQGLHRVAQEHDATAATLALAWSLNGGENIVLAGLGSRAHIRQAIEAVDLCGEAFVRELPLIPPPVLPLEATVSEVLRTGISESLVQLSVASLGAEVPLWVDGPVHAGDMVTVDGLTGKLTR